MKTSLSWKILFLLAFGFWVLGKVLGGVIGDSIGILVVIVAALGVVDLIRSLFAGKPKI